ncbi:MAG: hypothetical protein L6R41_007827, partial [Letrouitia leprolyta]
PAVAQLITALEASETNDSQKKQIGLVHTALNAVDILLRQDSSKEAIRVMMAIQTRFPSDVRAPRESHKRGEISEDEALRSLDAILAT